MKIFRGNHENQTNHTAFHNFQEYIGATIIRNPLHHLLNKWLAPLISESTPLYLVGGAVRDHLLGVDPKDIDIMSPYAERVARKIAKMQHAVIVPFEKKANEPCYRVVDRDDPDVFIDFTPIRGSTVADDMSHRDLTINAMAIRIQSTPDMMDMTDVIDPYDGREDLKRRIIRMTRSEAFVSDPLRVLRAFRFAAKLDFQIEPKTLEALNMNAHLLRHTSSERIFSELINIFATPRSSRFVRIMDEIGVLDIIFPEIVEMKGCTQNYYHHLDVWNHCMMVLEQCETILNQPESWFHPVTEQVNQNLSGCYRIPLLKLAALLHDIGKPATRGVRENSGRITFYGHAGKGAEIMSEIAMRLKMSNRDHEFLQSLVREHLHIINLSRPGIKAGTRMRWFRRLGDNCIPLLILGIADKMGTQGPAYSNEERNYHIRCSLNAIEKYYSRIKDKLERENLITGNDLIALGMIPGPAIGKVLKKVRDAQDAGEVSNTTEALHYAQRLIDSNRFSDN